MQKQIKIICSILAIAMILCFSVSAEGQNSTPEFNAKRAFGHLRSQVEFGPRISGQPGHKKTIDYITGILHANGFDVQLQTFTQFAPLTNEHYTFTNIIGVLNSLAAEKIAFSCHWDTRPVADRDPSPALRDQPIPGANDGASGVAVLLEMAAVLKDSPTSQGVCLIFFDGEDLGLASKANDFCYGSRYFAKNIPVNCKTLKYAVNIDMVGDKNLSLSRERFSAERAGDLQTNIWRVGTKLYPNTFKWNISQPVFDDHIPLLDAGISAIDIIDFTYPAWHTMNDDVSQCSPRSLKIVGDVLLTWLQELKW